MRVFFTAVSATLVCALAACNGLSQPSIPGNAPFAGPAEPASRTGVPDLYVADYGVGSVVLLKNGSYAREGSITNGIDSPLDVALDREGNLYVANAASADVTEYLPGASSPSFTYSAGMVEPIFLTVGPKENLYEVDSGGIGSDDGFVNEYRQRSAVVLHSCQTEGHPTGIAIDRTGNVFIGLNAASGGGRLVEYKRGLNGCIATLLGARFGHVVGLALDKRGDIVAADFNSGKVDVVSPPYAKITRRLTAGGRILQPTNISIDAANARVYVTDFAKNVVFVLDYASGRVLRKLNNLHGGISVPAGTSDGPNAVY
ncbi:MAG TPA: hypothetical protein VGF86_07455 [Candidatus Tumulicola sp.]